MTNTSHTPGPWQVKQGAASETYIDSDTRVIVACGGLYDYENEPDIEELEANARLIAASPLLYNHVASKASSGDNEAASLLKQIHGE